MSKDTEYKVPFREAFSAPPRPEQPATDDPVDEMVRVLTTALAANALILTTARGGYVGGHGQQHATLSSDPGATEAIARGLLARKVAEPSRVIEAAAAALPDVAELARRLRLAIVNAGRSLVITPERQLSTVDGDREVAAAILAEIERGRDSK